MAVGTYRRVRSPPQRPLREEGAANTTRTVPKMLFVCADRSARCSLRVVRAPRRTAAGQRPGSAPDPGVCVSVCVGFNININELP